MPIVLPKYTQAIPLEDEATLPAYEPTMIRTAKFFRKPPEQFDTFTFLEDGLAWYSDK